MKLLVDAHVFDGKFQGTRTHLEGLYKPMVRHKDVNFYFATSNTEDLKTVFGKSENIHYLKLKTKNSMQRLAYEFSSLIKEYAIDYAHFQYISPLQKCCKEIVTVHDILFTDYPQFFPLSYRIKNGLLFKRSAKRADILLTVSEYSRRRIAKRFDINESSIHITPNGVTIASYKEAYCDVKSKYGLDKYILTVSRIEPRKNHQMLLRAFFQTRLWEKGFKLVIVGAEDLRNKKFNELYNKLPLYLRKKVIVFQAPFSELIELYRQASLFVFPSFAEGFGIPPIEASVCGCPVLCSNATAMAEFDFFGENLFSPYDEKELERKMLCTLNSDLKDQVKKQRAEILKRYDLNRISDDLYRLILADFMGKTITSF